MKQEDKAPWQYKPDGQSGTDTPDDNSNSSEASTEPSLKHSKEISWEAPEFIEHHHGAGWYMVLLLTTLLLAAVIFLASSHDIIATVIVLTLGIIVGVFASYKPGTAKYEITAGGLRVNNKVYKYGDYKSFSIIREGQFSSINMLPLKRFMPPVAAYFDPVEEKKIMNAVGNYLPYEDRQLDAIDRLGRRVHL